jgi:flavin reductase (DIM6/NTAB) family NADH-FMN oxidoreductase RutF
MSVTPEQFKEFFRHHAAGVSLVTVFDENRQPYGFTASSLASLSAEPAHATVNLAANTSTSKIIKIGSKVSVHTLAKNHLSLAKELAGPRENRFQSEGWDLALAAPENKNASALLRAEVVEIHPVAGSLILVLKAHESETIAFPEHPLVYFNREFI